MSQRRILHQIRQSAQANHGFTGQDNQGPCRLRPGSMQTGAILTRLNYSSGRCAAGRFKIVP